MGSYKLNIQAEADLKRIWFRGLEQYGENQADAYFYKFFDRFEQLAKQPYLAPAVDEIRQGYRRAVCGVDSIYFPILKTFYKPQDQIRPVSVMAV